jgi:hypothetical protein
LWRRSPLATIPWACHSSGRGRHFFSFWRIADTSAGIGSRRPGGAAAAQEREVLNVDIHDVRDLRHLDPFGCGPTGRAKKCVDAKRAPSAKHTASRTSWLQTRKESQDVPVNFSWKLTKDKAVKYQSLELAGWYQTVPYLRL